MRSLLLVFTALTLAFATVSINAEPIDSRVVIVYPVSDLPVWSLKDGDTAPEFDPSVLTALVTKTINPVGFNAGRWSIAPHEKTVALVIRASQSDHSRIADLLSTLRKEDAVEVKNVPIKQKISHQRRGVILDPDPVLQQLEQSFQAGPIHVPLDVEILSDRLTRETAPHVWPVWNEIDDMPKDRDYRFGGVLITR